MSLIDFLSIESPRPFRARMRRSSQVSDEEQWEDVKHRLIVRAIEMASETMMERTQTTTEAIYWRTTNVVRRNLLMTVVRRLLWEEWNPEGEAGSTARQRSIGNLRASALRYLSDTVADHIGNNRSPSPSPPP